MLYWVYTKISGTKKFLGFTKVHEVFYSLEGAIQVTYFPNKNCFPTSGKPPGTLWRKCGKMNMSLTAGLQ